MPVVMSAPYIRCLEPCETMGNQAREILTRSVSGYLPHMIFADLVIALGEAIQNAYRHGSGPVKMAISTGPRSCLVSLDYRSEWFETERDMPEASTYPTSGMGIPMMRALLSRLDYRFNRDQSVTVTMEKEW